MPDKTFAHRAVRWFRNPAVFVTFFVIVMSSCVLGLVTWKAIGARNATLVRSETDIKNLTRSLAEHASNTIRAADIAMSGMADLLKYQKPVPERLNLYLANTIHALPQLREIGVLDENGDWRYPSVEVTPRRNNADRNYFIYHRDNPDATIRISQPLESRLTGRGTIILSRRIDRQDGGFGGVLTAAIDSDYFKNFYSTFQIGSAGGITLIRGDGAVLIRWPLVDKGSDLSQSELFRTRLKESSGGYYKINSPFDGITKYFGYEQATQYPLVLTVAISEADLLESWNADLRSDAIVAVVLLCVVILLAVLLASQFGLRMRSERHARVQSEALQNTLAHISQGLSVFDSAGRLVAYNDRFIELYNIPANLAKPGTSFSDLSDFLAQSDMLDTFDPSQLGDANIQSTTLHFKDGRRMQITHKPTEGGGWVSTHDDITDHVRARAELFEQATELARVNARFEAALDNMSQGLCLFDADKNLVVSNNRFQKMYGLPDYLVKPGTPLNQVLQFYKDRAGGDINTERPIGLIGTERSQDNALLDGRNILIQRTPLSNGGWVSTHQDVTEQKRLEVSLSEKAADLEQVNTHFDAALNSMSQGLCLFDAEQRVIVSNHQYAAMYKLSRDQVKPGTRLADILQSRRDEGTNHAIAPDLYLNAHIRKDFEVQELADGRFVAISRRQMSYGGWLTVHEDITERRMIEQERDRNRAFLHQIIEHIPTQITVKDARDRRYVLLNRVAESQLGPSSDVVGKTAYEIYSAPAADKITKDDEEALRSDSGVFLDEHEFESRNGVESRFVTARRVSICDENGDPAYLINLVEDVTERKRTNDRIAFLAHHDQLTGLANRTRFADKLDEAAKRCARHGTPFTVLMLDLDKFKYVNDTLGHPAGDQLLIQVAQRLKASLRDTDVLARLGGDEFAIIQEGESKQREGAIGLALRIIDLIGTPFDLSGNQANIGTSVGIAFAPECGVEAEGLLKKADLALYEAKSGGRNDYRLFKPEMAEVSDTQKVLEGELREAIQRDEFELYYQPVVDAKTGSIFGVEALVRWRHPTRGLVLPDQFIPLAESTGLMMPLGEWILQRACQDAVAWPSHIKVAINISAVQFNNANIFDVVLCALVESGLSPERLELEITETMLLKNEQACLLSIRQLKNLGIAIVLDDFGIGYSSSSYLTRIPFDKIKIDRSFVEGFPKRRECAAIIQSVLALARGLDIAITAEGVETDEQFESLRAAGVDLVQGYLFGRPVPLHQLVWSQSDPQAENVA